MKVLYVKNFRKGLATNSSSTHSVIYRNKGEVFEDLNVFELDFYDRFDRTIAATREAKIKYILTQIWRMDDIIKLLELRYPEMKQYYPLIKEMVNKNDEYYWGSCARGEIVVRNNEKFTYDYLCNIIDNDDIIIVGGSDEEDFVYDTCHGHITYDIPYSVLYYRKNDNRKDGGEYGLIKNGNYYLAYDKYARGKARLCVTNHNYPIPKYPELIDLLITTRCNNGCPFCYNNSGINGKDADIDFLKRVIDSLNIRTEFSIGGGNILLYPNLEELFSYMKENNHIINITINAKDVDLINDKKDIISKYVDGIGISVVSLSDVDNFIKISKLFGKEKYIACHIIPEILGFDKSCEILKEIKNKCEFVYKNEKIYISYITLFLGFKPTGRAINTVYNRLTTDEIDKLFEIHGFNSVDMV